MVITLTDVNKNNYEAVCDLTVAEDQFDYVAENTYSIVQSKFYPSYQTRAICLNGEPVGFFMWVPDDNHEIMIWRFMVDKNHQNKGIGRKALSLALDEIRRTDQLKTIAISYAPDNLVAKNLYASFGFIEVGIDEEIDEMIAVIKI
ncbi:GNAT family N-acetyltransferase [Xenorhabdus sp. 12]|uniref:GNAT family N-acetyltransferase n=1 Tax=Xenorhabdus santafensis TaxID=2582833 RepID=A0ABU4SB46_9GAMM|nr:GNAT family N-acetyltransferase [Xenorhabdus sp. 12]MDX7988026.1 GNAT family N-acetyltransferase [Xenorhabdus sp. 12]